MAFTCATAAIAALHAPKGVWIATLILAAICLIAAGLNHWREGKADVDSDRCELANTLAREIAQGDKIHERFQVENWPPWATAETFGGPIGDALGWAERVSTHLYEAAPEWLPEFRATGYAISPDLEADGITVADAMNLLSARVLLLGQIVRELRSEARGS